jgi:hypothetical protein
MSRIGKPIEKTNRLAVAGAGVKEMTGLGSDSQEHRVPFRGYENVIKLTVTIVCTTNH